MRITYYYSEYKDHPRATEISKSRERSKSYYFHMIGWAFIFEIIALFVEPSEWFFTVLLILLTLSFMFYLIKIYPIITEWKIQKAIRADLETKSRIARTKYFCKSIQVLDKSSTGMCNVCFRKPIALKLCEIKDNDCTRTTFICNECIAKFRSSYVRK